jgi:hypothetical protein
MNIRVVTVTANAPLTLAEDEEILERRADYSGSNDVSEPKWHLLIAKGGNKDKSDTFRPSWDAARETARDAQRDAQSERMRLAFAAGFGAFAEALKKTD